jgi:hypothetical protein
MKHLHKESCSCSSPDIEQPTRYRTHGAIPLVADNGQVIQDIFTTPRVSLMSRIERGNSPLATGPINAFPDRNIEIASFIKPVSHEVGLGSKLAGVQEAQGTPAVSKDDNDWTSSGL